MIKNNGDYKQIFNYNLEVSGGDINDYWVNFTVTPKHHPSQLKTYSFDIISTPDNNLNLESFQGSFTLNTNESILLSFNDNQLENNNPILNTNFNLELPYPNPFNPIINFY